MKNNLCCHNLIKRQIYWIVIRPFKFLLPRPTKCMSLPPSQSLAGIRGWELNPCYSQWVSVYSVSLRPWACKHLSTCLSSLIRTDSLLLLYIKLSTSCWSICRSRGGSSTSVKKGLILPWHSTQLPFPVGMQDMMSWPQWYQWRFFLPLILIWPGFHPGTQHIAGSGPHVHSAK